MKVYMLITDADNITIDNISVTIPVNDIDNFKIQSIALRAK